MAGSFESKFLKLDRLGYSWKGDRFPRVTTIKGKKSSGSALIDWAARMVAERAQNIVQDFRDGKIDITELQVRLLSDDLKNAHNKVRDDAADFGTVFHALLENLAMGDQDALHVAERELNDSVARAMFQRERKREPKDSTELRVWSQNAVGLKESQALAHERLWPDVEAFLSWHDRERPKWIRNEFACISRQHRYAGTCDAVVEIGGARVILDLKTSKGVYADYGLQLAAYRYADFIADPETGLELPIPEVETGTILHVRDGVCKLYEMKCGPDEYEDFLACCRLYWFDRRNPYGKDLNEFHPRLPGLSEAFA